MSSQHAPLIVGQLTVFTVNASHNGGHRAEDTESRGLEEGCVSLGQEGIGDRRVRPAHKRLSISKRLSSDNPHIDLSISTNTTLFTPVEEGTEMEASFSCPLVPKHSCTPPLLRGECDMVGVKCLMQWLAVTPSLFLLGR
jgi:hypothetical protein